MNLLNKYTYLCSKKMQQMLCRAKCHNLNQKTVVKTFPSSNSNLNAIYTHVQSV